VNKSWPEQKGGELMYAKLIFANSIVVMGIPLYCGYGSTPSISCYTGTSPTGACSTGTSPLPPPCCLGNMPENHN